MRHLGFETFAAVGHDRGAYTAFRMALDYPTLVSHLGVLDAVPISEALRRCDSRFAEAWWHWFFYAQPEKPEKAINCDPLAWYGGSPQSMGPEVYEDFSTAVCNPAVVHGMLEDYRAGLTIDRNDEAADREAGHLVQCPTLALWSLNDDLESLYGDVLDVWRPWAKMLQGRGLPSGHHMAEEVPEELASELRNFLKVQKDSELSSTDQR
jgi:haloacetate dehalogenase